VRRHKVFGRACRRVLVKQALITHAKNGRQGKNRGNCSGEDAAATGLPASGQSAGRRNHLGVGGPQLRTFDFRALRLERGVFPPPESETKLREYARALGLKPGTDEWIEFFDRAAASRGQIPQDLQRDENLVKHLPVLFRTLRGRKVSPEALDELVELIRTSLSNGR